MITLDKGCYTTITHFDRHQFNLDCPVEGFRNGWEQNMIEVGRSLKGKELKGFLHAFYAIRNSFLPGAYERSLPIMRFESKISNILNGIEQKY